MDKELYEAFMNSGEATDPIPEKKVDPEPPKDPAPEPQEQEKEQKTMALYEISVDENGNRTMSEETFLKIMSRLVG